MTRRIRQLAATASLAAVGTLIYAPPASASEETVGSCVFEELAGLEADGVDLHALEEGPEEELEAFEDDLEDCLEAPSPILPALDEIFWGGSAFLILFGFMVWKGFPAVKGAMDARAEKIRADLDDADKARADALAVQHDYEARLADAKSEAARLVDAARAQADEVKQELLARAESDIADLRQRADADIEAARRQAIADLRAEVSEIALGAAERVVGASLDRSTQSQLIDSYIDEVAAGDAR
ncbi:MAG: F0F1 ATP synthase subunit B [Acidimicrobiales bacterium]